MDSVKNWYRSKSMNFPPMHSNGSNNSSRPGGGYDFGNNPGDFKSQHYGPTDRAIVGGLRNASTVSDGTETNVALFFIHRKMATEVGKKLTPSTETKNTVVNAVEHYGRKLIPKEATKQKVSRFYESQVAKLKYSQLKEGYQPGDRDDLTRFAEEDSFYGQSSSTDSFRHPVAATSPTYTEREVPTVQPLQLQSRLRASSVSIPATRSPDTAGWNGSFMQYKIEPPAGRI